MPTPIIQIGQEPIAITACIAPGSPFTFSFINPDEADWTGIGLACDIRDMDDTLLFRVTSTDDEITVDGDDTTKLWMVWPAAKTALLADRTEYKFDIIVNDTLAIVWPYSEFTTSERVTEAD